MLCLSLIKKCREVQVQTNILFVFSAQTLLCETISKVLPAEHFRRECYLFFYGANRIRKHCYLVIFFFLISRALHLLLTSSRQRDMPQVSSLRGGFGFLTLFITFVRYDCLRHFIGKTTLLPKTKKTYFWKCKRTS